MILVIGLGTFLRALLFGAAAIALENLALRLRACGEISGPDLTRFPAGVGGIIEQPAR